MRLDIDHLHARYHLGDRHAIERLDRALAELADAIDDAVDEIRLPDAFAVCIDAISVEITVDASRSTASVARAWAAAIVESLRHTLDVDSIVVYPRRLDVIVDVVRSVLDGDLGRRWAWRQVGLVGVGSPDSPDLGGLLAAWPADALHVLASEPRIADALSADELARVAGAIATLLGVGASHRLDPAAADRTPLSNQPTSTPEVEAIARRIAPIVERFDARGAFSAGTPALRSSLVVVALGIEAPSHTRDATFVAQLTELLVRRSSAVEVRNEPSTNGASTASGASDEPADAVAGRAVDVPHRDGDSLPHPPDGHAPVRGDRPHDPITRPADHDDVRGVAAGEPIATAFGGTWFALHAIDALGLLDEIGRHADPPSVIAAVLARLIGAEADPSVDLAAGLDRRASDVPESGAELDEDLIADLTARIERWVRARLDVDDNEPLGWVWQRTATIEVEPAWVEVTFLLDDVDVRIRRAGLDLDPGFVWWRGAVVRFRYV